MLIELGIKVLAGAAFREVVAKVQGKPSAIDGVVEGARAVAIDLSKALNNQPSVTGSLARDARNAAQRLVGMPEDPCEALRRLEERGRERCERLHYPMRAAVVRTLIEHGLSRYDATVSGYMDGHFEVEVSADLPKHKFLLLVYALERAMGEVDPAREFKVTSRDVR